jgi:cytochrome c peroxidase
MERRVYVDKSHRGARHARVRFLGHVVAFAVALLAAQISSAQDHGRRLSSSAPEVLLGDRLFFETRFAHYFFAHSNGDVNASLALGDPVVREVSRPSQRSLAGPFRGQSMSCRHCHLGDDFVDDPLAQRTYCDFSSRSAIPQRGDGRNHTVRNTPMLVDFGLPAEVPRLLHFDGEFATPEDLVIDTLTGENMGWQLGEYPIAVAHIARVIRNDLGTNARHVKDQNGNGIPYAAVMLGPNNSIPPGLLLPRRYRLDVSTASDAEVLNAVAQLIHAYLDSIRFGTEDTGRTRGSPYDLFLRKNRLPTIPAQGESDRAYARRLLGMIDRTSNPAFVTPEEDGEFRLHNQVYQFGKAELAGLKLFLGRGNCAACHTPPQFTDHRFHNTGVSQIEYDAFFGAGAFSALDVPDLATRNLRHDVYLPATRQHPNATGRFRSAPSKNRAGFADLGVWNVFANPDFPKPQEALTEILCATAIPAGTPCTPDAVLPFTIGLFRTPSIRDLGHSEPYFHSGAAWTVEDALRAYLRLSTLARRGHLRNASSELLRVRLNESEISQLAAFMDALNEDYQ